MDRDYLSNHGHFPNSGTDYSQTESSRDWSGLLQTSRIPVQQNVVESPEDSGVPSPDWGAACGDHDGAVKATTATRHVAMREVSPEICDSPPSYTPESTASEDSMLPHDENATPPGSRKADSPGGAAQTFETLSLEQYRCRSREQQLSYGRIDGSNASPKPPKRAASTDLAPQDGRHGRHNSRSPRCEAVSASRQQKSVPGSTGALSGQPRPEAARGTHASTVAQARRGIVPLPSTRQFRPQIHRDSGYESEPRDHERVSATMLAGKPAMMKSELFDVTCPRPAELTYNPTGRNGTAARSPPKGYEPSLPVSGNGHYPGLVLQPDSSPISQDQLAEEIKSIYRGLVMVEAKCISIDAAQAADPSSDLGTEQWQALIALHKTLLYEHHDFLMATQHPSATPALQALATKYSMPARMWKHGIHTFLEVLRHRRPESQEFMLAFICLAYQMMALLFETVPSFLDTWIECLGDLARYRMAIEEEKEAHAQWGGIAARWYMMAADRHPDVGRLNHHLGILERPSLRKYCYYAKSLTCVVPFSNAKDSLATLCGQFIDDDESRTTSSQSAEARIMVFHARIFLEEDNGKIEAAMSVAVIQFSRLPSPKIREVGVSLILVNVAAVLQLGEATNALWQSFCAGVSQSIQESRPSVSAESLPDTQSKEEPELPALSTKDAHIRTSFLYSCTFTVLGHLDDRPALRDVLPSVHITLVWIHSLRLLRSRLIDSTSTVHTCDALSGPDYFSWGRLATFLNTLAHHEPIDARLLDLARRGVFPAADKPLAEDYSIRGLIWTQWYFPSGWFDEEGEQEGRNIETPVTHKARAQRVLWLGLYFALRTQYLHLDAHEMTFSAPVPGPTYFPTSPLLTETKAEPIVAALSPASAPSTAPSSATETDDGFTLVSKPKSATQPPRPTKASPKTNKPPRELSRAKAPAKCDRKWASDAKRKSITHANNKGQREHTQVKIADEDVMHWEAAP